MAKFKLINARSLREASWILKDHPEGEAVLMAGGTDLLVLRRHGLIQPRVVVRLDSNTERRGCRPAADGGMSIDAFTTLDDLARDPVVGKNYAVLAKAAGAVASAQIRHKATVGGNVCLGARCWFFNKSAFWRTQYPGCRKASGGDACYVVPQSRNGCFALQSGDTVGPLVALDARLRLVSDDGERLVDIADFYLGDGIRHLDLQPGEILADVMLPPPPTPGAFIKFRPQNNIDFATYTLTIIPAMNGSGARIVAASVASRPLRAKKAEEMLDRGQGDAASIAAQAAGEFKIVSFVRGGVGFKREVIEAGLMKLLGQIGFL